MSQSRAHFFRHSNGRPHVSQTFGVSVLHPRSGSWPHAGPSRGVKKADPTTRSALSSAYEFDLRQEPYTRATPTSGLPTYSTSGQGRHCRHHPDALGGDRRKPQVHAAPLSPHRRRTPARRSGAARAALGSQAICFDLRRGCSLTEHLLSEGRPTYLVDYERSASRTAIWDSPSSGCPKWCRTPSRKSPPDAGGKPVHLIGWCLGGLIAIPHDRRLPRPADQVGGHGRQPIRSQ